MRPRVTLEFFAARQPQAALVGAGFRLGARGTHSSRTMMLHELEDLLDAVPAGAGPREYASAVLEANCLGKATAATRHASLQRLRELYALDRGVPVFRALRFFWNRDPQARPLLALLAALARDPLLRLTVQPILTLAGGEQLPRESLEMALRTGVGERMRETTLAKVARNAASSWAQSGHLSGRTFKFRRRIAASAASGTFAIYLALLGGYGGREIWTCAWLSVLDLDGSAARELAHAARRLGLLETRMVGETPEFEFPALAPALRNSA